MGHHPHFVQGIETYKDKYIVFSLGNFAFGGNRNPEDKDTFVFQSNFEFTDQVLSNIDVKVYPASVSSVKNKNDFQPTLLSGSEKDRVLAKIQKYSNVTLVD